MDSDSLTKLSWKYQRVYNHQLHIQEAIMHGRGSFLIEGEELPRNMEKPYVVAYTYLQQCGIAGLPMTESMLLESMSRLGLHTTYRQMHTNIGIDWADIPDRMLELLGGSKFSFSGARVIPGWVNAANKRNPYRWMAEFHIRFEHIHPFLDGNGRIGRLLLVWAAAYTNSGVPLIHVADKETYRCIVRRQDINALALLLKKHSTF